VDDNFINETQSVLKDYLVYYLGTVKNADVQVDVGWPNYTNKLPLAKPHVTISVDADVSMDSPGFGDLLDETTNGVIAEFSVFIDVWSSRGSSTKPSKAGGKTGANKILALVLKAFSRDDRLCYDKCPTLDEIKSCEKRYSRNPQWFDEADIFKENVELVVRVVVQ
jgi:hypothetical protein